MDPDPKNLATTVPAITALAAVVVLQAARAVTAEDPVPDAFPALAGPPP